MLPGADKFFGMTASVVKSGAQVKVEGHGTFEPLSSIKKASKTILKILKKSFTKPSKEAKSLFDAILTRLIGSFSAPSPIQSYCWPYVASQKDVIGIAETGSGKTLAFSVPLLAKIVISFFENRFATDMNPQILVIAPTRELAIQINNVFDSISGIFTQHTKCNRSISMCLYGGTDRSAQIRLLKENLPLIIIGTPGRLLDLADSGVLRLSSINSLVLDEADRMLDMGFEPEIRQLVSKMHGDHSRQTIMFSATWPISIQTVASRYLKADFIKISILKTSEIHGDATDSALRASSNIKQVVDVVDDMKKNHCLLDLLKKYCPKKETPRTIIFVLYKKEAVRIEELCSKHGYECVALHGDMTQPAREKAYEAFRDGTARVLIATDVAARGLDIPSVNAVINYTFPLTVEDYVHRIGRTGRAGKTGLAHTLFTAKESHLAAALVAQLKASDQTVPQELIAFGGSTKRKEHSEYGAFYREIDPSKRAKHTKFEDDSE